MAGYVGRFLVLGEMGQTWGVTVCPSGQRRRLAVVNAGAAVYPLFIRRDRDGRLDVFLAAAPTTQANRAARRLQESGQLVDVEHVDDTPVPYMGFHLPGLVAAQELVDHASDAVARYVHDAGSRPLINRRWHNPIAGDLILQALA